MASVVDRIKVIDVDTHVSEPDDLWTSRVSVKRWGESVPHVQTDPETGKAYWYFNNTRSQGTAMPAMAGWKEFPPGHPPTLREADPGSWNPKDRLERMDEYGIHAQVIYPNAGGFGSKYYLKLKEPELMLACARAYNDFITEFCSADSKRLLPIMTLPFWDVQQSVDEINRCAAMGHRGILFGGQPDYYGFPKLADKHWYPIWAAAQDAGLTINFHIASTDNFNDLLPDMYQENGRQANYAKQTVFFFMDNAKHISEVLVSGICHRFPELKFVSVESGIGWVPFVMEGLDWQWLGSGAHLEHPEYELLPSEYFRRQVYACFWFERASAHAAIQAMGPDNFMYETDYPHPTSMSPGPASFASVPKDFINRELASLPEDVLRKVLHDNAAKLYHIE